MGAPSEVDDRRLALLADPTRSRILRLIRDSDEGRALVGELALYPQESYPIDPLPPRRPRAEPELTFS